MASAERLLHDAQYAFHNIGHGESRDNRRAAAKATSLCKKILRRYPGSMEAREAHAILLRLGDEAYTSRIAVEHRHVAEQTHHQARPTYRQPAARRGDDVALDWSGLISLMLATPKIVLGVIAFAGVVLFGIFGWFLFLPILALLLFAGPLRHVLKAEQRDSMHDAIRKINAFVAERRKSGTGFM